MNTVICWDIFPELNNSISINRLNETTKTGCENVSKWLVLLWETYFKGGLFTTRHTIRSKFITKFRKKFLGFLVFAVENEKIILYSLSKKRYWKRCETQILQYLQSNNNTLSYINAMD